MTDLYLRVDGPSAGGDTEGGPFVESVLTVGGAQVAHFTPQGWHIDDGAAFGDSGLMGTVWPVILGQAK